MADYLKVSGASMSNDINTINENIDKLPAAIEELRGVLTDLSACWEGEAWSAFRTQMMDDISFLQNVYHYEKHYAETFVNSKAVYRKTEMAVKETVNSISV